MSPDLLTLPETGQDFYGKNAGEMVSDVAVYENGTVTGTFKYVTGYTGFNGSDTKEQEGYFFPFCLEKNGEKMSFVKNGKTVKKDIAWEAENVLRVTAKDVFQIKVDGTKVLELKFDKAVFEPKGV